MIPTITGRIPTTTITGISTNLLCGSEFLMDSDTYALLGSAMYSDKYEPESAHLSICTRVGTDADLSVLIIKDTSPEEITTTNTTECIGDYRFHKSGIYLMDFEPPREQCVIRVFVSSTDASITSASIEMFGSHVY
jgi:hypothetical protein